MKTVLSACIVLAALLPGPAYAEAAEGLRIGEMYTNALNTLEANGYEHITDLSMRGGLVYATATKNLRNAEPMMIVIDPKARKIIREGEMTK